ncbi:MAG: hypothetical protein QE271_11340 [Bacteriovoracaceae bacterium]|nr:hypothetical protein [Bacteriovoracaceae bacterium]
MKMKLLITLSMLTVLSSCFSDSEQYVEDRSFYDVPIYGNIIQQLGKDHSIMMGIKTTPNGEVCFLKFDGYQRSNAEIEKVLALIDSSILEAKTWMNDKKAKNENGNNATYAKINCITKIFEDRKILYLARLGIDPGLNKQLAQKN